MSESPHLDPRLIELDHKNLHSLLDELAALPPDENRRDEWLGVVTRLRRRLEDHFHREEHDDSFLHIVREHRPNDVDKARALMAEHKGPRDEIARLAHLVGEEDLEIAAKSAKEFIDHLKKHETGENLLLIEAYYRDDGATD